MNLKEGKLLQGGKYRIESVLGQGGFGITYMAVQTNLKRKVAIKEFFMSDLCIREADTMHVTVPSEYNKGRVSKFKEKFLKEAYKIASLDNPHIIRIHDVFEENDTAYYVMEYIEGQSLADMVPFGKKLSEDVALGYIRQVAEALAEVHANGLLHLDIKPGNIMVDSKGRAVLIDFGVSKHFDDGSGGEKLTTTTTLPYTRGYAPLEQMDQDDSKLTPASDIYALGATLYRLLLGVAPLPSATRAVRKKEGQLPSTLSVSVRVAISAAMRIEEGDRPQSVEEFLALLNTTSVSLTDDDCILAEVAESTEFPDEREEKHEIVQSTENSEKRGTDNVAVVGEEKKSRYWLLWLLLALVCVCVGVGVFALFMGGETEVPSSVVVSDSDSVQVTESIVSAFVPEVGQEDTPVQTGKVYEDSLRLVADEQQAESASRTVTAVDLGLPSGTLWADRNVGADSPEDYGDYFAWGETKTKTTYNDSTYRWCVHLKNGVLTIPEIYYTKYCTKSLFGEVDGREVLEVSDDAATVHMGYKWRTPTDDEIEELINKCIWTLTTKTGVKGYKITGLNGNSIFIPFAGYYYDGELLKVNIGGEYWSNSLDNGHPLSVSVLYIYHDEFVLGAQTRFRGRTVRAVVR